MPCSSRVQSCRAASCFRTRQRRRRVACHQGRPRGHHRRHRRRHRRSIGSTPRARMRAVIASRSSGDMFCIRSAKRFRRSVLLAWSPVVATASPCAGPPGAPAVPCPWSPVSPFDDPDPSRPPWLASVRGVNCGASARPAAVGWLPPRVRRAAACCEAAWSPDGGAFDGRFDDAVPAADDCAFGCDAGASEFPPRRPPPAIHPGRRARAASGRVRRRPRWRGGIAGPSSARAARWTPGRFRR